MMRTSVMTPSRPLLMTSVLLLWWACGCQAMETLVTFRDPEGHQFQRVAVHEGTGAVYVGATNRLHRLNPSLTLLQSAATGPREDNPDCPPSRLPCSHTKRPMDGVTKGLAIDYQQDTLILCSTLYHGSCQKLDLLNITHVVRLVHMPLVPNKASATCVLFVGPSVGGEEALYIGAEYSGLGSKKYRALVPSISSRQLADLKEFSYRDQDGGTKKAIKDSLRDSFFVHYVHGFVHDQFAYFLSVQKEDLKSDRLVSRVGRVCSHDKYFKSYVEIPLHCQAASSHYTVLQAATLHGDRLVMLFSDASQAEWSGDRSSALCVLDMADLDAQFNETVEDCYAGRGRVGPPHYETRRTCMHTVSVQR